MSLLTTLINRAEEWMEVDPDPQTRETTLALIEKAKESNSSVELAEHFDGRLHFGTAGLRAAIGTGTQRMNRALIRWVSLGILDYLKQVLPMDQQQATIVIGFDGRHQSDLFAREAAHCFCYHGFHVELATQVCPTPLLAYGLSEKAVPSDGNRDHNPPQDNGFKVYWGNGAQIIPPQDVEISTAIDAVSWSRIKEVELSDTALEQSGQCTPLDLDPSSEIGQSYIAELIKSFRSQIVS